MTLDQRLAQAVRHVADGVVVPEVDPDAVRARARTNRRRTAALVAAAAVVAVVVAGATVVTGRDASSPLPPAARSRRRSRSRRPRRPSPTLDLDPGSWEAYTSTRYDFTVGHPPDWTEDPANRDWSWESDVLDHLSPAHEAFLSPNGHVRVSVWNAPLDASTREESIPYLVEWVEDYCEESGNSPCTGIADRAVELCLEKWDCHPGLLVPFENDVQAFFSGGIYAQDAMTVVAVWRRESSRFVARYGGSQRLLEAFLSTMEVWPSSTPRPASMNDDQPPLGSLIGDTHDTRIRSTGRVGHHDSGADRGVHVVDRRGPGVGGAHTHHVGRDQRGRGGPPARGQHQARTTSPPSRRRSFRTRSPRRSRRCSTRPWRTTSSAGRRQR